ncbi:MAG: hypothetical protein ABIP75_01460 [Pyrinomonadaceae bacterium]
MEKGKEIAKLVRLLRGLARVDRFAAANEPQPDAIAFSITQFNNVLKRLKELEPSAAALFGELADHSTLEMVRMAAHDLGSYFSDETAEPHHVRHEHRHHRRHHEGSRFRGCSVRVMAVPMGGRCG